jgi:hypothetical protein
MILLGWEMEKYQKIININLEKNEIRTGNRMTASSFPK